VDKWSFGKSVMFRQFVVIALVVLLVSNTQALCPAFIRIVNAIVPNTLSVDLLINNNVVQSNVNYNTVSSYVAVEPGTVNIVVRQSSNAQQIATRSFVAVPNLAYTIAATGPQTGPTGELLFNSSPFVFQETIYPPNQNTFHGYFHRLTEVTQTLDFQIHINGYTSTVQNIQSKTAVGYQEVDSDTFTTFSVVTSTGTVYRNSANQLVQLNTTTNPEILDIFIIGDDSTTANPTQIQQVQTDVGYDASSGCTLVAGSTVFSDISNNPQFSNTPFHCSASTISAGLAFLLAIVALLF